MVEQNGDILTDNQKELICQYFIAYCTSKRDTHWGIAEQKKYEEQFAILIPDWKKVEEVGLFHVMVAALNQAFFTLSIGIGSMEIFGSYMTKDIILCGESLSE